MRGPATHPRRVILAAGDGVRFVAELDASDEQAQAGPVDPIFAAIECHRAAATANKLAQARGSAHESKENNDAADKASDANSAAMLALIATVPASIEGLGAALEYIAANGFEGSDLPEFIRTLLQRSPHFSSASELRPATPIYGRLRLNLQERKIQCLNPVPAVPSSPPAPPWRFSPISAPPRAPRRVPP